MIPFYVSPNTPSAESDRRCGACGREFGTVPEVFGHACERTARRDGRFGPSNPTLEFLRELLSQAGQDPRGLEDVTREDALELIRERLR